MKGNDKFIPVLLGGDLNAYSMAMAFAASFGSVSEVFARERLAVTDLSSYINLHTVKELDDCNYAVPALIDFANQRKDERLLLIPCADWYVEMLEYARDALAEHFYFNIPDFEVWRAVSDKSSFTALMNKYGIPHPKTEIFDEKFTDFQNRGMKMQPPFVLKPSDSSEYWRNKFDGMKKVYFTDSLDEALKIGKMIYASGYTGKLLLQEYIAAQREGSASDASTLTVYMNGRSKAVRAVLGDILLEERGATSRGNYSAIVTRALDGISYSLIDMLQDIGYTGIANFDILRSRGQSYCLELNPRQGRSCDYVRCAGINLAQLLVSDMNAETVKPKFDYKDGVWRCVSKRTVVKNAADKSLLKKALMLEKLHRGISVYDMKIDRSFERMIYVGAHLYREGRRYKKLMRDGVGY